MNSPVVERQATLRDWLAVIGGVIGAFMAVMDISITNGSLRDIQGSLGTSLDETAWISSSYIIAEIIVIPLSGWLAKVFSARRFILVSAVLFVASSVACGMATTLTQMIVARAAQGLTGGIMIPMASNIIVTLLAPKQRTIGLSIYALSMSLGPAIGSSGGGWITFHYSWVYSFYIQIIPGILVGALIFFCLDPKPMELKLLKNIDWLGILTMAIGLSTLTYVLEEGNRLDWFSDQSILICTLISIVTLTACIMTELVAKNAFINLRLFLRPNFFLANAVVISNGLFLYGSMFLLPRYLIQVQDYNALQIGGVLKWFGFPQLCVIPFLPFLNRTFGARRLIIMGFALQFASGFVNSGLNHDSGYDHFIFANLLWAVGQPLVTSQLAGLAFIGMEKEIGSASALYNMTRQLAASLGISMLGYVMNLRYHFHFSRITETVNPASPIVQNALARTADLFSRRGGDGEKQAVVSMLSKINREAYVMAYADSFLILAIAPLVAIALLLFMGVLHKEQRTT